MKQWSEIIRNVTMLSQLGLSLITPVLICLAVCWLIVSKTGAFRECLFFRCEKMAE